MMFHVRLQAFQNTVDFGQHQQILNKVLFKEMFVHPVNHNDF